MRGGGIFERRLHRLDAVFEDAEIGDLAAQLVQQARQRVAVGVVDAAGRKLVGDLPDLVARREQGYAERGMDLELRATDGGGEPDILGTKPPALPEHHRAGLDVLAGMAPVWRRA